MQQLITKGMTREEVVSLVGEPRVKVADDGFGERWNYGTHWVRFSYGLVECVSSSDLVCVK